MHSFYTTIRHLREKRGLLLRKAASSLDIDPAILSKVEHGKRRAKRELVEKMESLYEQESGSLVRLWLSERILNEIEGEPDPGAVLKVAEEAVRYQKPAARKTVLNLDRINEIFKAHPAITRAWIFGSFARDEQGPGSDLDIMLEISREARFTLFDLAEIREKLHRLTGLEVDVVISRSLRPGIKARAEKEKKLIYEA